MGTHAADQQMQAAGCRALGNLFGDEMQARKKHAQLAAKATKAVVAAMTAHTADSDVQHKACSALYNIAVLNETLRARPLQAPQEELRPRLLRFARMLLTY
jgi:hypothetical protein